MNSAIFYFPWRHFPRVFFLEEEEEEAVFIRGVNTNEDSPNAQHAPHRLVQDTGAMSAWRRYMPDLQLCCSVYPYHPVDTCQGEEEGGRRLSLLLL